jgi:hypothetical protein
VWRIACRLSRLLDRDERAAVCGDLAESGASGARALLEVAGLVVRRQIELWLDWRPWVALVTVVAPLGLLLSVASRWFADNAASKLRLYMLTGEWAYFAVPGWRDDVIAAAVTSLMSLAALAAWSWTTGFVLGRVSRRASQITALLFALVVVFGTVGSTTTVRDPVGYGALGRMGSHGSLFVPIAVTGLVRLMLVLVPAWRGVDAGGRSESFKAWQPMAIAVLALAITTFTARALEGSLIFGWGLTMPQPGPDRIVGTADDLRPVWWASLAIICPALCVLAGAIGARTRVRRIST